MDTLHIQLTERDRQMLAELGDVGLLDGATLHRRHFPADQSGEACGRRLRLLRKGGIIDVFQPAISFGPHRSGRLPMVYRLTPTGANILQELSGERPSVISGNISALTLEHRLGVAKLRLLVGDACKREKIPPPEWIGEYDLRPTAPPLPSAKLSERYLLCHQYTLEGETLTCWPDAAALIPIPHKTDVHHLLLLLEFDRSTERLAQVKRKIPGYNMFLNFQDYHRLFKKCAETVRVFFVTKTIQRGKHIAEAIRPLPGSDVVRWAPVYALKPETFFTERIWWDCEGRRIRIITPKKENDDKTT